MLIITLLIILTETIFLIWNKIYQNQLNNDIINLSRQVGKGQVMIIDLEEKIEELKKKKTKKRILTK